MRTRILGKMLKSDEVLVEVIARHYELLKYICFDNNDGNIPQDYDYRKPSKKRKVSRSKYIATAVEALIAAIYLDNEENMDLILEITAGWKTLIDKNRL